MANREYINYWLRYYRKHRNKNGITCLHSMARNARKDKRPLQPRNAIRNPRHIMKCLVVDKQSDTEIASYFSVFGFNYFEIQSALRLIRKYVAIQIKHGRIAPVTASNE